LPERREASKRGASSIKREDGSDLLRKRERRELARQCLEVEEAVVVEGLKRQG